MLNKKIILKLIVMFVLLGSSCGREDEIIIEAMGLDFAYRNGKVIREGDCIDPNQNFAVLVHATMGNFGTLRPQEFDVVVNEILYSVTFRGEGTKLIPIDLKPGENHAKIEGTNHEAQIFKTTQGDFELVE